MTPNDVLIAGVVMDTLTLIVLWRIRRHRQSTKSLRQGS